MALSLSVHVQGGRRGVGRGEEAGGTQRLGARCSLGTINRSLAQSDCQLLPGSTWESYVTWLIGLARESAIISAQHKLIRISEIL